MNAGAPLGALAWIGVVAIVGCGPGVGAGAGAKAPPPVATVAVAGRPLLTLVRRDGDPQAAIAVEVRGEGLGLALYGALLAHRLSVAGFVGVEAHVGARYARVRALAPALSSAAAEKLDQALVAAVTPSEAGPLLAALDAYAARPVDDSALARAAACLDRPTRPASFLPPPKDAILTVGEAARAEHARHERLSVAVVGMAGVDAFATAFRAAAALPSGPPPKAPAATDAPTLGFSAQERFVLTASGLPRGATTALVSALADPTAALALRLRAVDDLSLVSVRGAAHAEGGCVVIEVAPPPSKEWSEARALAQAATAADVARQEIALAVEAGPWPSEGAAATAAIAGGGDPREAADRAAWWAFPATGAAPKLVATPTFLAGPPALAGGTKTTPDALLPQIEPRWIAALDRARIAGARAELELKTRVEQGQWQVVALLASSCGATHEGFGDAGVGALAVQALAVSAEPKPVTVAGVVLEPWPTSAGLGLLAHAVPKEGESTEAVAHRVGDALGRAFLATPLPRDGFLVARNETLALLSAPPKGGDLVASALASLAPAHPSWLDPRGTLEAVAKASPELAELRLSTLRRGPLRLAVVGPDVAAAKVARAAERWVPRRAGESRTCPVEDAGLLPKGLVHARTVKGGTGFSVAVPVDDPMRDAGPLLAALLQAKLEPELSAFVGKVEVRFVRGMGRHAIVVLALAADANVDPAVARARAVLDKVRAGTFGDDDVVAARKSLEAAALARALDPRARAIDAWLGPYKPVDVAAVRKVAAAVLVEERHQLVIAHLK